MIYKERELYLKEAISNMNLRINKMLDSKELPLHSKIHGIKVILEEYTKEVDYYN